VCQFLWNSHNVDMHSTLIQSHFQCHCMLLSPFLILVFQTKSFSVSLHALVTIVDACFSDIVHYCFGVGTDGNFIQMTFSQGSTWISLSYICKLALSCYHAKWMLTNWFLKRLNKLSDLNSNVLLNTALVFLRGDIIVTLDEILST